ncbi:MFS transporter [Streptomyces sp. NPDC050625]|uniref:MFS transporter n=1 Tax=Streptomyces sp. NPDC050625 TaxID=3154629 RepID=UPI003433AE74
MTWIRRGPRATFALLACSVCSYALMQAASVPTLPVIQAEFQTTQTSATWTLTAFLLTSSIATPILGRLGDAFGKRRVLLAGLAAVVIGCLLASASQSIGMMIGARAIQGLGGGMVPLAFAIVRDELPAERVVGAIAALSAMISAGFATGIVVAGIITAHLGFRMLFLLPAIFTALTWLAVLQLIPNSRETVPVRLPLLPAALLAAWLSTLLLGVSYAPRWGWTSPRLLAFAAATAALATGWGWVEWRASVPMIDLRLMKMRGVWTANLVALMTGMASFGAFPFFPQFNQTPPEAGYGFGVSVVVAGYLLLPASAMSAVAGGVSPWIARRIGSRGAIVAGGLISACALASAALLHDEMWQVAVATALTGLGSGIVFTCLANAVVAAVPPEQTGVATGTNANLRTIGGAVGSGVMATILAAHLQPSGYSSEAGYTNGFLFLAIVCLTTAACGSLISRDRTRNQPEYRRYPTRGNMAHLERVRPYD